MSEIVRADTEPLIEQIRMLFIEYADSLGFDLDFQGVDKDFADLPGEYGSPGGCLYLALDNSQAAGCVGLRRFSRDACEMKRLYVRPQFRGMGIGRSLSEIVIDEAKRIGYSCMRLDTVDTMTEAIALYRSLGFVEIEPYRYNPVKGARFMELALQERNGMDDCPRKGI